MEDVIGHVLKAQNPWWDKGQLPGKMDYERKFFKPLWNLAINASLKRSVVMIGQRRIGKTVMLNQLVRKAMDTGIYLPGNICYVDLERVGTTAIGLHNIVDAFKEMTTKSQEAKLVLFDEIQFAKDWPRQLKVLTDHEKEINFVATGSVSAAMNPKNRETGYGRLIDFYVPPLLFCEYLEAHGKWPENLPSDPREIRKHRLVANEVESLNDAFVDYIHQGTVLEFLDIEPSKLDKPTLLKDAINRAIPRDIAAYYDIRKFDELMVIFNHLAKNNGRETSKKKLSTVSGLSFNTINSYIRYLQDALLIRAIQRRHKKLKLLQRESKVKYMLENSSHHSILFGETSPDDPSFGHLVEATAFAQVIPFLDTSVSYTLYKSGNRKFEIDMAHEQSYLKNITRLSEIKWSDDKAILSKSADNLRRFSNTLKTKPIDGCYCTTKRTYFDDIDNQQINFLPVAQYCISLGMDNFEPSRTSVYSTESS